jgi:S-DNA-T family DNA segregation ATPase FtsK/SpoIIIE
MAQARKRKKNITQSQSKERLLVNIDQRLHEAGAIFLFALTGFLLLCLLTYNSSDPGFVNYNYNKVIYNSAGRLGAWFADIMYYFFGLLSYWIPGCLMYAAYKSYQKKLEIVWPLDWLSLIIKIAGFFLGLFSGSALASLYFNRIYLTSIYKLKMGAGGVFGKIISLWFIDMFNLMGATVLLLAGFFIGITLVTGLSWLSVFDSLGQRALALSNRIMFYSIYLAKYLNVKFSNLKSAKKLKINRDSNTNSSRVIDRPSEKKNDKLTSLSAGLKNSLSKYNKNLALEDQSAILEKVTDKSTSGSVVSTEIKSLDKIKTTPKNMSKVKQLKIAAVNPDGLPDVSLLELPDKSTNLGYTDLELHELSRLVEQKLSDFNIEAQVVGVLPGPVIVRFELHLAPGIKVSKISSLAKDLARSLSIVSVRVVEVIPGKPYVGLEVPNTHREVVRLRELLEHPEYSKSRSPLTLVLGKDISGKIKLADLSKMPHLLVAGTTGSGKSVGVNAMLMSILFKATPKDVRLIMIDPKMLELSVYDGIPHLLCPVVTDMKDAANSLKWCVAEMDRRYKLMATLGVRNLASCNRKIEEAAQKGDPILDPLWPQEALDQAPELEPLPFIVVVVDEFADMIMVVGRKVEELIARIAQKARAAGIHMILATQRPSVDVITGLIKANVPTRIAFQVSSKIDSRTILDQQGAEQLLGQGDMLYLPPGSGLPVRVHGAFVSDQEVHDVTNDWRSRQQPDYNDDIIGSPINIQGLPRLATDDFDNNTENDPLYDQAVAFVLETRKASISSVQRRFKIGYNRAANIVEAMESAGILGSIGSKGVREVLIPEGQGI